MLTFPIASLILKNHDVSLRRLLNNDTVFVIVVVFCGTRVSCDAFMHYKIKTRKICVLQVMDVVLRCCE